MNASNPSRQPKGIPVGGQFTTSARAESGVTLDTSAPTGASEVEYIYPDITETTSGDEMKQAGEWVPIQNATLLGDGTMIRIDFKPKDPDSVRSGGSMTFPVAHRPAIRRAVTPEASNTSEPVAAAAPKRLRNMAQVRTDEAFLADMEEVEREVRVRDLEKGDWVREIGDDEYGVVKSVGLHTLTTDTWRDDDTDEGDHVVAVVRKDRAAEILDAHGALPSRTVTTYRKRREAALAVADRWDAASSAEERRAIGYHDLRKAARDVWLSTIQAGLSSQPDFDGIPNRDTLPAVGRMEKAFYDYNSLLSVAGHSDERAAALVGTMRGAISATDRYFDDRPPSSTH